MVATRRGIPLDRKQLLPPLEETTPNVFSSLSLFSYFFFRIWKQLLPPLEETASKIAHRNIFYVNILYFL